MLSYIEISKANLLYNFSQFRAYIHPKTKIISVVKANAYGHGLPQVVQILENDTDYFAIDDFQELEIIRSYTKKPVLVLGYIPQSDLEKTVLLNADLMIYDLSHAERLNKIADSHNKKVRVHIKVDALLGRQGILPDDASQFAQQLKELKNLDVVAVYAHFANIEDTTDFTHAQNQIEAFQKAIKKIQKNGFKDIRTHISSSAGTIIYEKDLNQHDFIRLGIALYGLWPSSSLHGQFNNQIKLKPALRWVTHIAQIKTLPTNHPIGYGLTYITNRDTTIAIIPQGYSDGYDRGLSNNGEVLIHHTRCKVLGRIAMNMFAVDVSHLAHVHIEDEVVLLGKQGDSEITAEELAEKIDTINYEITARISPSLPRIVK